MLKRYIILAMCALLYGSSLFARAKKNDALRSLDHLSHFLDSGYTVVDESGEIDKHPYSKVRMELLGTYAIRNHSVFMKVVDYDSGETYFTKNMSFSVVNGFIENDGGLKIKRIEHPCNMIFLCMKNSNGIDRWYVDLVYDDFIYSDDFIVYEYNFPAPFESFEIEFYECSGNILKNRENMYFQFSKTHRVYNDILELDTFSFSNVDAKKEIQVVSEYAKTLHAKQRKQIECCLKALAMYFSEPFDVEDFPFILKTVTDIKELL